MQPNKGIAFGLLGITIAIFGLSVSMIGVAYTQAYSSTGVNVGVAVGAVIAYAGIIVALVPALSLKE